MFKSKAKLVRTGELVFQHSTHTNLHEKFNYKWMKASVNSPSDLMPEPQRQYVTITLWNLANLYSVTFCLSSLRESFVFTIVQAFKKMLSQTLNK